MFARDECREEDIGTKLANKKEGGSTRVRRADPARGRTALQGKTAARRRPARASARPRRANAGRRRGTRKRKTATRRPPDEGAATRKRNTTGTRAQGGRTRKRARPRAAEDQGQRNRKAPEPRGATRPPQTTGTRNRKTATRNAAGLASAPPRRAARARVAKRKTRLAAKVVSPAAPPIVNGSLGGPFQ